MREIPLTKGYVALVDDDDYERLKRFNWTAAVRVTMVYAKRREGPSATFYLHREVLGLTGRLPLVDHVNRDGLDCRRSNLRTCSPAGNMRNSKARCSHGIKGTYRVGRLWAARIRVDYKRFALGCYSTQIEAGLAYDEAAKLYFGEFARLNFPDRLHVPNNGDEQWTSPVACTAEIIRQ